MQTADPVIMAKYPADPNSNGQIGGNDFIVFRYSDILLMRAEALNEMNMLGDALPLVNQVRNRSNLPNLNMAGLDQTSLRNHIFQERKWEFYFEGKGRMDMVRQGTLINHVSQVSADAAGNPDRYLYLPIPLDALTQNPGLNQNPGY